jgi:hypothetical protein
MADPDPKLSRTVQTSGDSRIAVVIPKPAPKPPKAK